MGDYWSVVKLLITRYLLSNGIDFDAAEYALLCC